MDLTYKVPKQAYIDLLADMIRRNERRPIRVFTLFLLTVVQMAAVILLCIFRLNPDQRVFFLVWSILLAALTLLRRCTVMSRAKGTLRRLEYTGQLPEDFWKEHKLGTVDGQLRLRYGAQRISCPLHGLSRVEERAEALHLYCGETMFDIVPDSAFPNREAMKRFARSLRDQAAHSQPPTAKRENVPEDGLSWHMEENILEDGQYLAFRTLYYRHRFLRSATFVRLVISVLAVINLFRDASALNIALSVVLLVLANLENLSMLPFICRLRIRREVGDWRGSEEYHLSLRENTVVFASDRAEARIPVEKINLCEKVGPYYLIGWSSFPAVVLPAQVWQTPEVSALTEEIKALYQKK
ncbi:hypothetical protein [Oscillibacter sp.]|uniref:hypothetical protein n=1 Tax=Oscillibacter sp. TaxID=1945593 RepID=UPI0028A7800D|nr:hypothetical protein [Oscillibacter sp.]